MGKKQQTRILKMSLIIPTLQNDQPEVVKDKQVAVKKADDKKDQAEYDKEEKVSK